MCVILVRCSAIAARLRSVIWVHCPMFRTRNSRRLFESLQSPSSVILHELSSKFCTTYSPLEIWFNDASPILSQKLTSKLVRFNAPSARCAIPSSPIPSQERKFNSRRLRSVERCESPLSVIPQQKLRFKHSRFSRPFEMFRKALSVIFWQSCKHKWVKFLFPHAGVDWLEFRPARCAIPVSEICRQLRRLRYLSLGKPQAQRSKPVFVILQHPARSNTSRLLRNRAIFPMLVSVSCLHKLKFSTVKFGRSLTSAWLIPMSVTL